MLSPSVLKSIAMLAPGKRVTVVYSGASYELPEKPEPILAAPPDPLQVVSQQLLERDAQTRGTVAEMQRVMQSVASGQVELARSLTEGVKEIVGTLHLPVVPTKYDKDGRIIEARRKEKM